MPIVAASTSPFPGDVFITELQTTGTSASQEFIELYNNTPDDINLGNTAKTFKLQFFSSTKVTTSGFNWDPKTSGLTTVSLARSDGLASIIAAHSYFIVSTAPSGVTYSPGGVDPDLTYSSGHMSDTGGGVQLVDVTGTSSNPTYTVHDHVGWYKPTDTQSLPAGFYVTPPANGSLQRTIDENENYQDTDGNLLPMTSSDQVSPKESWSKPADPDPSPTDQQLTPDPQPTQSLAEDPQLVDNVPIIINELLPNPASPATDSNDEFVELYNPTDTAVNLKGYTVRTGLTYAYSYTLKDQTIEAGDYLVLTSGATNLALSNSGGQAELLGPDGQVLSSTDKYENAPDGQAWARINGTWQWTTTPTPGAANTLTQPPATTKTTKAASTTTKKSPAKKSTSTKSTKAAKTSVPATAQDSSDPQPQPASLHPALLVGAAILALGYALYEYKADVANKLRQFRSNRATRRALRSSAQG